MRILILSKFSALAKVHPLGNKDCYWLYIVLIHKTMQIHQYWVLTHGEQIWNLLPQGYNKGKLAAKTLHPPHSDFLYWNEGSLYTG